ncbi:MAG: hypothetical protein PHP53_05635 [Prolixibacteraceae bacterium]|nr:hypothetical protein [Prolixibacteraceae bacterium]
MVDRTERIHIRASKVTKARWASFCNALDKSTQSEVFEGLMAVVFNREFSGAGIIKSIKERKLWIENYEYAECDEDCGECESE